MNEYGVAFEQILEGVDKEEFQVQIDLINEVIELTIMKKPVDVGSPGYKGTACPNCAAPVYIPIVDEMTPIRVCANCGQRIDWTDDIIEEEGMGTDYGDEVEYEDVDVDYVIPGDEYD